MHVAKCNINILLTKSCMEKKISFFFVARIARHLKLQINQIFFDLVAKLT